MDEPSGWSDNSEYAEVNSTDDDEPSPYTKVSAPGYAWGDEEVTDDEDEEPAPYKKTYQYILEEEELID